MFLKEKNKDEIDMIEKIIEIDGKYQATLIEALRKAYNKIDKAIEYINTWIYDEYSISIPDKEDPVIGCVYEPNAIDNLLNILNGDSNDRK